jgi:Peptidoglycan-binding protein, CsiV
MPKNFYNIIVLFVLLFFHIACWADPADPSYQIEIIVYSHLNEDALRSEFWPRQTAITIPANTLEISKERLVAPNHWQLAPLQQSLKKNGDTILLHTAWTTSATQARQGETIHLQGNQDNSNALNGILGVRLDRYFNITLNLQFSVPWQSLANLHLTNIEHNPNDSNVIFRLSQDLRMRSDELNYIDHPLFGVLIKIIPLGN